MSGISDIDMNDFVYPLSQDEIALYPLEERDSSKLLVCRNGKISEDLFRNIPSYIPEYTHLIYNETRVIRARLLFTKKTGSVIEIFCLEPVSPVREIQQAFAQTSGVVWKCLVGNSKRWKSGTVEMEFGIEGKKCILTASRIEQNAGSSLISFSWGPSELSFSEVLENAGVTPLPPYLHRQADDADKFRYQTIYARQEGSVAAPTAGLHFTEKVFKNLEKKKVTKSKVTLHVGAGTFRPVGDSLQDHEMHSEKIFISKKTITAILENLDNPIAVTGTTTMRTIESLYWHGVKLILDNPDKSIIDIHQWDPYEKKLNQGISAKESLQYVLHRMIEKKIDEISGNTKMIIVPGYNFKIADILVTNFHMPRSTLLLLVAAFIGDDWKKAYDYAQNHEFRFLSYGDSCLFFRKNPTG